MMNTYELFMNAIESFYAQFMHKSTPESGVMPLEEIKDILAMYINDDSNCLYVLEYADKRIAYKPTADGQMIYLFTSLEEGMKANGFIEDGVSLYALSAKDAVSLVLKLKATDFVFNAFSDSVMTVPDFVLIEALNNSKRIDEMSKASGVSKTDIYERIMNEWTKKSEATQFIDC